MSATYLAYIGALSAAWASMDYFCLRSDILWSAAATVLCVASLLLRLRVDAASFVLTLWFILLASSGVVFAALLPFWT